MKPTRASTFDPQSLGLRADFRLTDFARMKGCSCKVPRDKLLQYLHGLSNELKPNESPGEPAGAKSSICARRAIPRTHGEQSIV
jgi:hypothetical protein